MITRLILAAVLLAHPVMDSSNIASDPASDRLFQRLRSLEGEWEGTFHWSGGRTNSGPMTASYHLTGGGSALIENLYMNPQVASSQRYGSLESVDLGDSSHS